MLGRQCPSGVAPAKLARRARAVAEPARGSGETATHTYAQPGAKTVTLTVTDNSAVSATASQTLTLIALSARVYKGNGHERVALYWNGASGASYDVYRDGVKVAAVQATAYTDNLNSKPPATYTYRVCEPVSSTCSSDVSVSGIGLISVFVSFDGVRHRSPVAAAATDAQVTNVGGPR